MKTATRFCLALIALPLSLPLQATLFEFNGINQLIPDNDPSGFVNRQTLQFPTTDFVRDINVRLKIVGVDGDGFTGDLYVWLQHGSGLSVLLNRPGQDIDRRAGYANDSIWTWLDDQESRDIHTIDRTSKDSWVAAQPDGRQGDPDFVPPDHNRAVMLSSFWGLDPNGEWNLFVSDLAGGGQMRLESWALEVTTADLLPEGGVSLLAAIAALVAWTKWNRVAPQRNRID